MMMKRCLLVVGLCWGALTVPARATVLTVTTTNNVSPAPGETSLKAALASAKEGDVIQFNIPGTGPHYIATPDDGYPFITANGVTIDGYSQHDSSPNSSPILGANSAKIKIVLDSRNGGHKLMDFAPTAPNDDTGYGATESAVLGVVGAQGFKLQGVSMLGVPVVGPDQDRSLYFVSFAQGASGRVSGCWLGVDPDGKTVAGAADGVTGFLYRGKDDTGTVTNSILVSGVTIGVEPKATNAVQQFNVIAGMTAIPIIVEGDNTRVSGNFITVLPDGLHDFDVALDDTLKGSFEGSIEIGRSGNNTLIGTDGDGVNDENERNVFGGMLPKAMGGYDHLIEFYGTNPGTNIVLAGNYIGVGIDGKTRFTNGIPVLNASGTAAQYRIGSDFNGVSDDIEGNLIANNYPSSLFPASDYTATPEALSFLDELSIGGAVSLRRNSLINNFPFPASPVLDNGAFLLSYYSPVLADPTAGFSPALSTNSTRARLKGSVPVTDPARYSSTIVDLYVADPVGMTNGAAAAIPELPQGFVQGLTYLASFTEGSAADLDSKPGAFEFDLIKVTIPAGASLTITANYVPATGSSDGSAPDISSITRTENGSVTITWEGQATVQSAASVVGPWNDELTTGSSFTAPASAAAAFYRLKAEVGSAPGSAGPPLTSPFSNAVQAP